MLQLELIKTSLYMSADQELGKNRQWQGTGTINQKSALETKKLKIVEWLSYMSQT